MESPVGMSAGKEIKILTAVADDEVSGRNIHRDRNRELTAGDVENSRNLSPMNGSMMECDFTKGQAHEK